MKKLVDLYQVQVVWNREFDFVNYSIPEQEFNNAKSKAEDIINSGDKARIKKYRILNSEGKVVYPFSAIVNLESKVAYKIWHDKPYYIHKNSTVDELIWTTDIKQAKIFNKYVSELTELNMYESLFKTYDKLNIIIIKNYGK